MKIDLLLFGIFAVMGWMLAYGFFCQMREAQKNNQALLETLRRHLETFERLHR